MSACREITKPEKAFENVISSIRKLDKLAWNHGNDYRRGSLELLKEHVKNFDITWNAFKEELNDYEKELFSNKL